MAELSLTNLENGACRQSAPLDLPPYREAKVVGFLYECGKCGRGLFETTEMLRQTVKIKCRRCKHNNVLIINSTSRPIADLTPSRGGPQHGD